MQQFKYILSWVLWPALFIICCLITQLGFHYDSPILYFNIAYLFLIVSLFFLEQWMPHERAWLEPDGQNIASILHTLTSKGTVQGILLFSGVIGFAEYVTPLSEPAYSIWPRDWPLWTQVLLGVTAAEFGLYWAHRLAHEVPLIWRFHAIHHSVTKLWFLNTGRFHFIDSLFSIALGICILLALGAPLEVVTWLSAITAFIGMLTHTNVEMRFGWINYIFNTPGLHRWHHSKKIHEGNTNYGENIMLWDIIFNTFYNADYRPPKDIGINDHMPKRFIHQLAWPFLNQQQKTKLDSEYRSNI